MHSPASIISIYGNFLRETKANLSLPRLLPSLSLTEHFAVWPRPAKQMRSPLQTNILREFWTVDYFYWHDDRALMARHPARKHGALALRCTAADASREEGIRPRGNTASSAGFLRDYSKRRHPPRRSQARADPKWHVSSELCWMPLNGASSRTRIGNRNCTTLVITKYLLHRDFGGPFEREQAGDLFRKGGTIWMNRINPYMERTGLLKYLWSNLARHRSKNNFVGLSK